MRKVYVKFNDDGGGSDFIARGLMDFGQTFELIVLHAFKA